MLELSKIKQTIRYPACFIAFGFGTGLLRGMPGTMSTLFVGVPLYHFLNTLPQFYYGLLLIFFILLGVLVCSIAEEVLEVKDDPIIVWDEICGYLLTMLYAPKGLLWLITGFLLFRVFDILKPWPIDQVDENISGGVGIMLDDILAATYAGCVLYCLAYIL